jgi:hypothetical protein
MGIFNWYQNKKEPEVIDPENYYDTYNKRTSDLLLRLKLFRVKYGNLPMTEKILFKRLFNTRTGNVVIEMNTKRFLTRELTKDKIQTVDKVIKVLGNLNKKYNFPILETNALNGDDTAPWNIPINRLAIKRCFSGKTGKPFCELDTYVYRPAYD